MPDRLSALDHAFLALDGATRPLHVGFTLRFGGPAPSLSALRAHLDARLGLVPRFRRRLASGPLGLGGERWADDEAFAVSHHVQAVSLPAPGGEAELRAACGTLLAVPLDPTRPLWRVVLVQGLARGEWAIVGQAHHALVDGVAAVEVAVLLFGPEAAGAPATWAPDRAPVLAHHLRDAAGAGADAARAVVRAARSARADARRAPALLEQATAAIEALGGGTAAPLPPTAGARRAVAFASVDLRGLKEAGRRHGATLNDVLLAASGSALGASLRRGGADVAADASLRALVPVSVRGDGGADALGNRLSFLAVDVPTGLRGPLAALRAVRDATHDGPSAPSPRRPTTCPPRCAPPPRGRPTARPASTSSSPTSPGRPWRWSSSAAPC